MHTPGHTFNHTSYVLESPDGPVAIFSGGSMLVGAVGRSDLLGPDHTEELLALQEGRFPWRDQWGGHADRLQALLGPGKFALQVPFFARLRSA